MVEHRDIPFAHLHRTRLAAEFADYSPSANGTGDDSAKLTQAIADAASAGLPLALGAHTYALGAAVPVLSDVDIVGCRGRTVLRALEGLTPTTLDGVEYSVLLVLDADAVVYGVQFDGADTGVHCGVACHSSARTELSRCLASRFFRDGIYLPPNNGDRNNNLMRIRDCKLYSNGRVFAHGQPVTDFEATAATSGYVVTHAATASAVAGPTTAVTFSQSIADIGVRPGTPIALGDAPRTHGVVVSADSDTELTCIFEDTGFSGTGLDWAIGLGDGMHIGADGDNNMTEITSCEFSGNRGFQLALGGFYGATLSNCILTYAPWGCVRVGHSGGTHRHGTDAHGIYCGDAARGYSGHLDRANWTLLGAQSVDIHQKISEHAEGSGLIVRELAGANTGAVRYRSTTITLGI